MKPSLIPIACGTALALMAGAAAAHWSSVNHMAALASLLPADLSPARVTLPAMVPLPDDKPAREAKHFLAEARRAEDKPARPATASNDTDARFEKLLSVLEGTVEQNAQLRDQMANTNRDMLELQLRVDSYDGQFRPLKIQDEPRALVVEETTAFDDGVLPPIEYP
jgi:hypothetical protein